jgi:hypothetical protein
MERAQCAIATTPQQRLRPSGGNVREEPGTVATAARRTVAASEGGGRPCHRSRPLWRGFFIANTQHKQSVVQSVAVHAVLGGDGPRDGLSTAPSWAVTATAAYSCDQTMAALLLRLGNGWRWRWQGVPALTAMGSRFTSFFCCFSAFFFYYFSFNSARFVQQFGLFSIIVR